MIDEAREKLADRRARLDRLRDSEERYRRIVESAPDPIFVIEPDMRIAYVNKHAAGMIGRRSADIAGCRLADVFAPEVAATFERNLEIVFKTKKPLFSEDLARAPGRRFWLDTKLTPILDKTGRVEAVLGVSRDVTGRRETEAELDKSYRAQNVLNRLLEISLLDASLDEQLQLAIDIILSAPFMPLQPKGGIFVIEDDREKLILKVQRGLPDSLLNICAAVPFGDCLCGRAAAGRRIVFAADLDDRHDHRYEGITAHGHYNIPILSQARRGQVLGVIVLYVDAGHKRDRREEEFLLATADVMAGLIERKQVEEALRKREALSDALNRINAAINSTLDFERIMKRVAEDAAKAIGCEAAAVILREEGQWTFKHLYGLPHVEKGLRVAPTEAKCAALAARTKKPVTSADAYNDKKFSCTLMKKLGVRSFLSIPLSVKDDTVGVLDFYYRSSSKAFTDEQLDFADKLGVSVSLALENARLYAVEHNIADTLQEALLIMAADIPGIDFGCLYRSATEATEVGGDFYDIFELDDDKIAVVMGDVSGKGLEAATLTSLVKSTIKAYSYQGDAPASVIKKTNMVLCKSSGPFVFVSVFFGVLDKRTGVLTYCSAGHPPAFIKRGVGEAAALSAHSPVIGVLPGFDYSDNHAEVGKGEFLVLYTDGATEARRGDQLFGETRLQTLIEKTETPTAQTLAESVFSEIERFAARGLADDVALLVVGPT